LKAREELAKLLQSENPLKEKIKELSEMFVESLRGRVCVCVCVCVDDLRDSNITGKITFVVAERQADPLLARRLIHDGSVEITNKLNVVDSPGLGRESHKFLEAEGVFNCSKCGVQLCRHCVIGKESVYSVPAC
jgi:hypothetical protein